MVVPVSILKSGGTMKKNSLVTGIEGFDAICDYSTTILEDTADKILSGDFDKSPKVYSGTKSPCDYCKYKSVCRFNDSAGKEKTIYKDNSSISEQIDELKFLANKKEKPQITKADFYNSEDK